MNIPDQKSPETQNGLSQRLAPSLATLLPALATGFSMPPNRKTFIQRKSDTETSQREQRRHQETISALRSVTSGIVGARKREDANQKKRDVLERKKATRECATIWGLFITAVIALCGAGFSACQSWLFRDQEQKQLRAYVFVPAATGVLNRADRTFTIKLEMKNFGQTPAYHLTGWYSTQLRDYPLVGALDEPKDDKAAIGETLLAPTASTFPTIPLSGTLSEADHDAILNGKKAIYVWGRILYKDAFDLRRCINFRMFYGGESARRGAFADTNHGNNEDCNSPDSKNSAVPP